MRVQILLGEQLEQVNANQLVAGQNTLIPVHKLVNPSLLFKIPFMPGSFDVTIIAMILGLDPEVEHKARIQLRKSGTDLILADTADLSLPKNFFPKGDGLNLNIDFRKISVRSNGEYEIVFTIDGAEHYHLFEIIGAENLTV